VTSRPFQPDATSGTPSAASGVSTLQRPAITLDGEAITCTPRTRATRCRPSVRFEHLIAQVLPLAPNAAEQPIKVYAERYSDATEGALPTREVLLAGEGLDLNITPREALALADAIRRAAEMLLADEDAVQPV